MLFGVFKYVVYDFRTVVLVKPDQTMNTNSNWSDISILESCRSSSGTAMNYIQHVRYGWVRVIFATSINISVISMMTSFIGCVNIWISLRKSPN